jgi:DNA-nicking Smr family endonuclease
MPTKKKTSKKPAKSKKPARKKAASTKAQKRPKKVAKRLTPKRKEKKRKEKKKVATAKPVRTTRKGVREEEFPLEATRRLSGELSGDLQGLSRREAADSESVDELLEEGNAFEADVVAGVESADDADEREVHTHEVPEDDVPSEYLDEE